MDDGVDVCTSFKPYLLNVCFVPDLCEQMYLIQRRLGMEETRRARERLRMHTTSRKRGQIKPKGPSEVKISRFAKNQKRKQPEQLLCKAPN